MVRGRSSVHGRRSAVGVAAILAGICCTLAFAPPAAALTLGLGWVEPEAIEPEMLQVGKSGAQTFRVPLSPFNDNDGTVAAAAANGVTIHAEVSAGSSLPVGSARSEFIDGVAGEVRRYGYGGQFWAENPTLPYEPITTWEVGNEPNYASIAPDEYGIFLNEIASAIQAASRSQGRSGTEVLSAGLLIWGNQGLTAGNWEEREPISYQGALRYLEEAYPYFGGNPGVTGIAIHPYELNPKTFPGSSRIGAFEDVVAGFHEELVRLDEAAPKSLWITESGWPAAGEYGVGAEAQASLLEQAIDFVKRDAASLDLGDFVWYNLRDPSGLTNWTEYCGLRARDGSYRPAWTAFQEEAGAPSWPAATTGGDQTVPWVGVTLGSLLDP